MELQRIIKDMFRYWFGTYYYGVAISGEKVTKLGPFYTSFSMHAWGVFRPPPVRTIHLFLEKEHPHLENFCILNLVEISKDDHDFVAGRNMKERRMKQEESSTERKA